MIVTIDVQDIVIDIVGVRVNVFKEHRAMSSRKYWGKRDGIRNCEVYALR